MGNKHASQAGAPGTASGPGVWDERAEGTSDAALLTLVACAGLAALLLSLATRWMG